MRDGNFSKAFDITVMGMEGGSKMTNDPDDPGGLTRYGISKANWPKVDVAHITKEGAQDFYWENFWKPAGCENLAYPIDIITFDRAVLYGLAAAKRWAADANSFDDILFDSLKRTHDRWKDKYARGWIGRIVKLWEYFNVSQTADDALFERLHSLYHNWNKAKAKLIVGQILISAQKIR